MTAQRKHPDRPYVRNQLNDEQLKKRFKDGCPVCEGKLVSRSALKTDNNTGQRRFAGNFFGCSNYGKGCEAEYSVGLNGNESYYTDEEASAAE